MVGDGCKPRAINVQFDFYVIDREKRAGPRRQTGAARTRKFPTANGPAHGRGPDVRLMTTLTSCYRYSLVCLRTLRETQMQQLGTDIHVVGSTRNYCKHLERAGRQVGQLRLDAIRRGSTTLTSLVIRCGADGVLRVVFPHPHPSPLGTPPAL